MRALASVHQLRSHSRSVATWPGLPQRSVDALGRCFCTQSCESPAGRGGRLGNPPPLLPLGPAPEPPASAFTAAGALPLALAGPAGTDAAAGMADAAPRTTARAAAGTAADCGQVDAAPACTSTHGQQLQP